MYIFHAIFFIIREKMFQQCTLSRLTRSCDSYNGIIFRSLFYYSFYFSIDIIHSHFMQIWNPMPKLHKNQMRNNVFLFFNVDRFKVSRSQSRRVTKSQSINSLCDLMTLRPYDFNFQLSCLNYYN